MTLLVSSPHLLLSERVQAILDGPSDPASTPELGLRNWAPADPVDALRTLDALYTMSMGPVDPSGGPARWQHHPELVELRTRLEAAFEQSLDRWAAPLVGSLPEDAVAAVRALAQVDRVPAVYEWLATRASWSEVREFIALEGGPDDSFDDLVAICQLGLPSEAKLELARNYWDELGNGDGRAVHRELHRRLVAAVGVRTVEREEMSEAGLARGVLGGFLATHRRLQPEMVGALGTIELQAGPRCRRVVQALERLGAAGDAVSFYEEHAVTDPRHGKDWLDHAVADLAARGWGDGIVRGAAWRVALNRRFFSELATRFEI